MISISPTISVLSQAGPATSRPRSPKASDVLEDVIGDVVNKNHFISPKIGVHPPKKVDFTQHKFEKFTIWSDMISGGLSRGFVIKIWSLAGYKCTFLVQKYWTLYTQHRQFQTNPRMTGTIGHGGVWTSMTFGGMGLLVRSIPTYTQPWYTNNSP